MWLKLIDINIIINSQVALNKSTIPDKYCNINEIFIKRFYKIVCTG